MMSRKEYRYWQNRKDRVSEYICVRASDFWRQGGPKITERHTSGNKDIR